ncbi:MULTISPECIES: NADPH-dependent F420 reductase [Rhizobium]|uniref:Coenzyme F420-dependent NADP oxidoreductase n=1 Tax=Rhizobium favelukesii TaxID=348824 RepID=W6RSI5_9HYPH|nr:MULTISPECIES: NAD(P)-binding domain-containing protein [Rhizobium]UFS79507.1 NAD(P)-binding domain-containing protein [Rhizobium sp. T136]CDM63110.1 coenzyme F420-dependent NADP oxidoreductase [Rhizobium favelukesii]
MKIGIIGIGNIGGTLARKLASAGHEVRVANSKGADAVQPFAEEIGATAADTNGAIAGADLVIISIPLPAIEKLSKDHFSDLPASVPVVDTSNYYPGLRDPQITDLDAGEVESVWVSKQLGRSVIKAFNNILAHSLAELGQPEGTPGRLAVAVAGDNDAAKQLVMRIVSEVGFDPVDSGPLSESWRQQPSTPGYCCDYDAPTMRKALDAAVKGEASKKRDQLMGKFATLGANPTHDDVVAMNRSLNPLQ